MINLKRKYKLILIIISSLVLTYLIYFTLKEDRLNIVAIGDGISSGETSYNIDGISYNDYIKEYFENKKLLKSYNNSFSYKNYQLNELIYDLKDNVIDADNKNIQQVINKANLLTLSIGEEELVKLSLTNDLNKEYIDKYMKEYDSLVYILDKLTEAKIVIVGFYENAYLKKSDVIILNSNLSNIAIKYNAIFVNVSDLLLNKEYYLSTKDYYFNYKAHKEIAQMIIHSI